MNSAQRLSLRKMGTLETWNINKYMGMQCVPQNWKKLSPYIFFNLLVQASTGFTTFLSSLIWGTSRSHFAKATRRTGWEWGQIQPHYLFDYEMNKPLTADCKQ